MVDGTGTTSYTYRTPGQTGAGKVATIDGPLASDTLTLAYDDLGRATSRTLDATAEGVAYDALGRVTSVTNPLDTFTLAYSGTTGLPLSVTGAKGLSVTNAHYGPTGDYRVETTAYAWSGTQALADFGYQYDAGGRLTRWDHQVGAGDPRRVVPGYDAVSRLINAVTINPSTSAQITAEANRYDKIGNRLGSQSGSEVKSGVFNVVNQLQSLAAGGEATLQGALNEPGTVTVGSRSTKTDGANKFRLSVPVTTGTNQLSVVSEDVNGNTSTNTATFTVATSGTTTFTYDLNGNTTNDGQRTYQWDGANRLVKVIYSGTNNYTEFTYDGACRRVRIKEVESGTTTSDKRFVFNGISIAERRASDGTTVERRYFGSGFQEVGSSSTDEYFYVRDHLGSVRAVIDDTGVERGRWNYSLWGIRGANQITTNPVEGDFGYTGHYNHARTGFAAAWARFYDPATTRWLSRDPIGENGGINLYGYVSNNPINAVDPYGLWQLTDPPPTLDGPSNFTYPEDHFLKDVPEYDPQKASAEQWGDAREAAVNSEEPYTTCEYLEIAGAIMGARGAPRNAGKGSGESSMRDAAGGQKGVNTNLTAEEFIGNLQASGFSAQSTMGSNGAVTVLQNGQGVTYTVYTRSSTGQSGVQYIGPSGKVKFNLNK